MLTFIFPLTEIKWLSKYTEEGEVGVRAWSRFSCHLAGLSFIPCLAVKHTIFAAQLSCVKGKSRVCVWWKIMLSALDVLVPRNQRSCMELSHLMGHYTQRASQAHDKCGISSHIFSVHLQANMRLNYLTDEESEIKMTSLTL